MKVHIQMIETEREIEKINWRECTSSASGSLSFRFFPFFSSSFSCFLFFFASVSRGLLVFFFPPAFSAQPEDGTGAHVETKFKEKKKTRIDRSAFGRDGESGNERQWDRQWQESGRSSGDGEEREHTSVCVCVKKVYQSRARERAGRCGTAARRPAAPSRLSSPAANLPQPVTQPHIRKRALNISEECRGESNKKAEGIWVPPQMACRRRWSSAENASLAPFRYNSSSIVVSCAARPFC